MGQGVKERGKGKGGGGQRRETVVNPIPTHTHTHTPKMDPLGQYPTHHAPFGSGLRQTSSWTHIHATKEGAAGPG
jgi:hypothetical protein